MFTWNTQLTTNHHFISVLVFFKYQEIWWQWTGVTWSFHLFFRFSSTVGVCTVFIRFVVRAMSWHKPHWPHRGLPCSKNPCLVLLSFLRLGIVFCIQCVLRPLLGLVNMSIEILFFVCQLRFSLSWNSYNVIGHIIILSIKQLTLLEGPLCFRP